MSLLFVTLQERVILRILLFFWTLYLIELAEDLAFFLFLELYIELLTLTK